MRSIWEHVAVLTNYIQCDVGFLNFGESFKWWFECLLGCDSTYIVDNNERKKRYQTKA